MIKQIDIEPLLAAVFKPSRYIDNELNTFHKDPQPGMVNFCLAFPDLYEIGFSHLGLKLLYTIINREPNATCDRVYAPDKDLVRELERHNIPLFSVENRVSLKDFDILGFTLQSELTYTNILYMLEQSRIPLLSEERKGLEYPLIIGGGPCAVNPEPLAMFFDLFFIGEAEEAIIEIKNMIKKGKEENLSKEELLEQLGNIEGVYVPGSHSPDTTVTARKYTGFSDGVTYKNQLISWQQTTHDRYIYEIMRGCSRGCRFCLAGYLYRPVRERDGAAIIKQLAEEVIKYGWEETALLSLSSADYSCIKPLIKEIISQLSNFKTDISLPSLRVDSLDDDIIKLLNRTGQTGITIAPEAGSQRLRDIINKEITEEQILDLIKIAVKNNWKIIKLYFMVGLPFETEDDIEEIVLLVRDIIHITGKRQKINITLSPFIPKPHTPFQWADMLSQDELYRRISHIKRELSRYKTVKIKYHTIENSLLECIMTRGDRKVGRLIYQAYKNGAFFDGWDEHFNINHWLKAAQETKVEFSDYTREFDVSEVLSWDHINLGIEKNFLIDEYRKAAQGKLTDDCRTACSNCGLCTPGELEHVNAPMFNPHEAELMDVVNPQGNFFAKYDNQKVSGDCYRYRVFYSKKGLLKYVAHLDMLRMTHRILRRTGLPLRYTEGFNRHPKINFCPPLSVGVEGLNEFMDIDLLFPETEKTILSKLREFNIKNLEWLDVKESDFESLPEIKDFIYEVVRVVVPSDYIQMFQDKTHEFKKARSWEAVRIRKGVEKKFDLKEIVVETGFNIIEETGLLTLKKRLMGASIFDILMNVYDICRDDTGRLSIQRLRISSD